MLPLGRMCATARFGLVAFTILGALTSPGAAEPRLTVSFTTSDTGGEYLPRNVVAAWIEGPFAPGSTTPGPFVRTVGRWAGIRWLHLVAWRNRAGDNDVDAISGATRADHGGAALTATWDAKDRNQMLVPDGEYRLRIETADRNASATIENDQGSFAFTKGPNPDVRTITTDPEFPSVTIDYQPRFGECDNSIQDPGETCDPPGTCPTACDPSGDACRPNVLVGSAAACTAACAIQDITSCVTDDGCCPAGCTPAQDDDCVNETQLGSGCATQGTGSGPLALLASCGLVTLLRRRRAP